MPKRVSDVSLNVYATPEALDRVVENVRQVVDEQVAEHDVFAWRFTLPVDADQPPHVELENQWRTAHPETDPGARATSEIVLSLVGDPNALTEQYLEALERQLLLAISREPHVPCALHAEQRESFDIEENREFSEL